MRRATSHTISPKFQKPFSPAVLAIWLSRAAGKNRKTGCFVDGIFVAFQQVSMSRRYLSHVIVWKSCLDHTIVHKSIQIMLYKYPFWVESYSWLFTIFGKCMWDPNAYKQSWFSWSLRAGKLIIPNQKMDSGIAQLGKKNNLKEILSSLTVWWCSHGFIGFWHHPCCNIFRCPWGFSDTWLPFYLPPHRIPHKLPKLSSLPAPETTKKIHEKPIPKTTQKKMYQYHWQAWMMLGYL